MPITLSPEELFNDSSPLLDHTGFEPPITPVESEYEPPADAAPAYQPLQQTQYLPDPRIDQLQGAVNALLSRPQQPIYIPPQPQQQPVEQGWKDHQFMTPDDARALLTSPNPESTLNSVFNRVAQQIYAPMAAELSRRDAILVGMHQQNEMRRAQAEQSQRAQHNVGRFYQLFPDLADFSSEVQVQAQQIAYESQQNPYAYINITDTDLYSAIAQRVRGRIAQIRGEESYTPPAQPQRIHMERGSGSRHLTQNQTHDPNTQALRDMDRYKRQ